MGGRLALRFAHRYPERVASLTLLSTHLGLPENERAARLKTDQMWADKILSLSIDDFLKQWYDQPVFNTLSFEQMKMLRQRQNRQALAQSLLHYSLGLQPIFYPSHVKYLVGEHDHKYRELYQDLHPIVIPGASHAIHWERPELIAQNIEAQL